MRMQLAIAFLVVIVSSTYASPHLVRRQATPPAGEAAPAPGAAAPAPPAPGAPAPPAAAAPAPPAPAAPAPPAPAAEAPTARQAPPRPVPGGAGSPAAGPSVFTLPDGAGLVVGAINGGFTCENRIYGYYADLNNDCKIFHVCVPVLNEQGEATQPALIFSFFCNNGTIFNQEALVCDYADSVDCSVAESFYSVNEEFGKIPEGQAGRAAPGAPAPAVPARPPAAVPPPPPPAAAVPAPATPGEAPAAATPAV